VVLYSSSGLYDVGINAVAVDLERVSGRRFMSYLHAAFSGGAMAGAVGAGALLQAGVDYRLVYLALLLPLVSLVAAFAAARFPSPGFGGASGEWSHSDTSPAVDSAAKGSSGRWDLYRSGPLLLVAAITCLGLLAEGEMEHWSGIYLRDTLGLAAVAPVAFSVAGELVPERAGSAVSVVTTFGYGGFLLGSPLVGGLAEVAGLRTALGVVAVAGLAIFMLSLLLQQPKADTATEGRVRAP
jgi:MFS family permease